MSRSFRSDRADVERELLRGNTPLLVLAILRDGPSHGYAMAQEISRRSLNELHFKQGTLYPVLNLLEEASLVRSEWEMDRGGRPRKVYNITPAGQEHLIERLQIWETFANAVSRVVKGVGSAD